MRRTKRLTTLEREPSRFALLRGRRGGVGNPEDIERQKNSVSTSHAGVSISSFHPLNFRVMNKTRKKAISAVYDLISSAIMDLQMIKADEEECMCAMPENLQGGQNYEKAEESVDAIETAIDSLEEALNALSEI